MEKHISTDALVKLFKEVGYPNAIMSAGIEWEGNTLRAPVGTYISDDKIIIELISMRGKVSEDKRIIIEKYPPWVKTETITLLTLHYGSTFCPYKRDDIEVIFLKDGESYKKHFPRLLEIQEELLLKKRIEDFEGKCNSLNSVFQTCSIMAETLGELPPHSIEGLEKVAVELQKFIQKQKEKQ